MEIKLSDGRESLWQWDTGRYVSVDTAAREIHFSREGARSSHTVQIEDGKAKIPDHMLVTAGKLIAYVVEEDENGEMTVFKQLFDVLRRPKPEDYIYTEQEIKRWEQLEQRVDALEKDGAGGGTTDHTKLTNRDAADQHTIEAITGLSDALDEAKKPEIFTLTITSTYDDDSNRTITTDHTYEEVLGEISKGSFVVAKHVNDYHGNITRTNYVASVGSYTKMLGGSQAIMFYSVKEESGTTAGWWYGVAFVGLLKNNTVKFGSFSTPQFEDEIMNIDGVHAKRGLLYGGNCLVGFASSKHYVAPKFMPVYVTKYTSGSYYVGTNIDWETEFLPYLAAGGFAYVQYTDYNLSDSTPHVFMPVRINSSPDSVADDEVLGVYCRVSDDSTKLEYISIKGNKTFDYSEVSLGGGSGIPDEQAAAITANTAARHTHSNKTILDSITAEKITEWDGKSDFSGSYNDLTDKPTISSGTPKWYEVASITTEEDLTDLVVNQDADGNMITAYNPLAINARVEFPADSTQTSATGQPWFFPQTVSVANDFRIIGNVSSWKTVARAVQYSWWGDGATINSNGSTTLGKSGNANINKITGFRIYVNASGDHIPVGTKVYVSVLGVKPS